MHESAAKPAILVFEAVKLADMSWFLWETLPTLNSLCFAVASASASRNTAAISDCFLCVGANLNLCVF
jgi:hypothetical protein